ncbi:Thymidylate kinase [uncultured Ruminococcus sp.]|uniref:Thymidylate kinase n=1 Tax=Massiliimalia timonensis TaxID=1987501 RepID=A0A8J6TXW1_9FIRM|nr:deoxynucleoside kinase [Massiliimalia timonensis]MBC8611800.1 AAA family ATPase [Massiliimalia timonensis]SCH50931.1 Thymidylate kinase [uncultured Clostridium sp.]SCH60633.1 Thymidylate kinase [uncultured Ruminococcus sp.]
MRGKLIVLDGLDGSGKSTQAQLLADQLRHEGNRVELLSYPDYSQPSSALVKLYLNGELADNADDVNAYAASSFYAVDRYASYMQFWKDKLEQGITMIASRYVSSNAIHQMGKLPREEWDAFLQWLDDFEYQKLGLPRPDQIIFLDMSRAVADRLIMSRYHGDQTKKDLHEQNMNYMQRCMESAHYAALKQHWELVRCCDGKNAFPIEQIAQEIMKRVKEVF